MTPHEEQTPENPIQATEAFHAGIPARDSTDHSDAPSASTSPSGEIVSTTNDVALGQPSIVDIPRDPVWSGLDVLRLTVLAIVALFVGIFSVLLVARFVVYPHSTIGELSRVPLVIIAGRALAYFLIFGYMYILVTRENHRPDFLAAIHWNWPTSPATYLLAGLVLSVALQILASRLPIPKSLPIDSFFRTTAEAWVLTIFGITLAPLMEEFFFRGFLYPVLARGIGLPAAVLVTAFAFALLHASQLSNSWGPVLVIFLVGMVLTIVRAKTNSVAAGLIVHVAYNGTLSVLMLVATGGFRHLEKLNQ